MGTAREPVQMPEQVLEFPLSENYLFRLLPKFMLTKRFLRVATRQQFFCLNLRNVFDPRSLRPTVTAAHKMSSQDRLSSPLPLDTVPVGKSSLS